MINLIKRKKEWRGLGIKQKMEQLKKLFINLGYREEDIKEIITAHGIGELKPETLLENVKRNYEFLISLGYSQEEVIKMTKSVPSIYSLSIENIKQKIENQE